MCSSRLRGLSFSACSAVDFVFRIHRGSRGTPARSAVHNVGKRCRNVKRALRRYPVSMFKNVSSIARCLLESKLSMSFGIFVETL
jgi:hypothetical protein